MFKKIILYELIIFILFSANISIGDDVLNYVPAILSANKNRNIYQNVGTVISSTGRIWMDKNLGAKRVATNALDKLAFGDLYQWGRLKDGHEKRTSHTTTTTSYTDIPGHSLFITPKFYSDWRNPRNKNLWQGVSGINNPCPSGFRLPTSNEFRAEIKTWRSNNPAGAFASPLKLVLAGYRLTTGVLNTDYLPTAALGDAGCYWTSSTDPHYSFYLSLTTEHAGIGYMGARAEGCSVRCIKNY